jgi:hypothetical protein
MIQYHCRNFLLSDFGEKMDTIHSVHLAIKSGSLMKWVRPFCLRSQGDHFADLFVPKITFAWLDEHHME